MMIDLILQPLKSSVRRDVSRMFSWEPSTWSSCAASWHSTCRCGFPWNRRRGV